LLRACCRFRFFHGLYVHGHGLGRCVVPYRLYDVVSVQGSGLNVDAVSLADHGDVWRVYGADLVRLFLPRRLFPVPAALAVARVSSSSRTVDLLPYAVFSQSIDHGFYGLLSVRVLFADDLYPGHEGGYAHHVPCDLHVLVFVKVIYRCVVSFGQDTHLALRAPDEAFRVRLFSFASSSQLDYYVA